jgi:hypothetical protein
LVGLSEREDPQLTSEDACKATLDNLVAVKLLREKFTKGHKEFEVEAVVLGKIRHPNLLMFRVYHLGPKEDAHLRLHAQGSLSTFHHNQSVRSPFFVALLCLFQSCPQHSYLVPD